MFRIDAKWFFLTYPQCPMDRNEVLAQLKAKCHKKPFTKYVVGQETHQDGNLHLHCLLGFDTRFNCTNAKFFDLVDNGITYHGNYQAGRSPGKLFLYCTKTDIDFLSNWKPEAASKTTRAEIGEKLIKGEDLKEVAVKYPQLIFDYNKLKANIETFKKDQVTYDPLPYWLPNDWGFLLNTRSTAKQRHWWIWSSQPNRGKTTHTRRWAERFPIHVKTSDFTYWELCGREEVIIFDDYNSAGIKWNALNQICDGTYEFRIFMGGIKPLRQLRLVIVFSNQRISDLYPHMNAYLYARFMEKCID